VRIAGVTGVVEAATPFVSFLGVTKTYPGASRPAVADVSLEVRRGEFLAVVGASGSGKTTTLKMINRLIEPSAGTVLIEGAPNTAIAPHLLRRRIGYAFQGAGLFPHLTAAENIGAPLTLLDWTAERIAARQSELFALVELDEATYAGRFPSSLSGGERQRVGFARALAAAPSLMLLDEPFGALDPLTRDALARAYRAIHARLGLTTVMVTHDIGEAILLADRIAMMRAGALVAVGPAETLANGPDADYVRALFAPPLRQARGVVAALQDWAGP
jgi:osmoprotectant transport system ATP-binding protein